MTTAEPRDCAGRLSADSGLSSTTDSRGPQPLPDKSWIPGVDDMRLEGVCACRFVRYRLTSRPLFVHCCHCRWCQRETGSAFAVNALIEAERVSLLEGSVEVVRTPSESGKGQKISRCPHCRVALWSNYAGSGELVHFVRVGTLLEPDRLPPDIHIYTASKLPWVVIPSTVPVVPEFYDLEEAWPRESLKRRQAILARLRDSG